MISSQIDRMPLNRIEIVSWQTFDIGKYRIVVHWIDLILYRDEPRDVHPPDVLYEWQIADTVLLSHPEGIRNRFQIVFIF